MTIVEFLNARLDEDWAVIHREDHDCDCGSDVVPTRADCPARWAAEVAAKRAIIARHVDCDDTGRDDPCEDLRHLACVYADHPDYQQEWRP